MTELPAAPPLGKPRRRGGNLIGKAAFAQIEFAADSPLEGAGFEPSVPQSNRSFGDNPNRPLGPLLLYGKMRHGRQMLPTVPILFAPAASPLRTRLSERVLSTRSCLRVTNS